MNLHYVNSLLALKWYCSRPYGRVCNAPQFSLLAGQTRLQTSPIIDSCREVPHSVKLAICCSLANPQKGTSGELFMAVHFTGQMPLLSPNQQCQSTERLNVLCILFYVIVYYLCFCRKTPNLDEKKDPSEGLMDLLKQMYEEGDDEMKRTIAKSWCESRNKQSAMDL